MRCEEGGQPLTLVSSYGKEGIQSPGPFERSLLSPLQQKALFLLFHERVSCFLSCIVLYWRWKALESVFLALRKTSTCRESFSWLRKLRLLDKRNLTADILSVPSLGEEPTFVSFRLSPLKLNHFWKPKNNILGHLCYLTKFF